MLTSEARERIRRAYYIDHKSVRHISVEQGHSRDTINRIIAENPPAVGRRTRRKPAPVFGPFLPRIDELMERNERLPQKQRYTAHKIFEVLQSEGYQGCESRVRQYIASVNDLARKSNKARKVRQKQANDLSSQNTRGVRVSPQCLSFAPQENISILPSDFLSSVNQQERGKNHAIRQIEERTGGTGETYKTRGN